MARTIIGAAFVSLDGVMQAPGGAEEDRSGGFAQGGWLAPVADEAVWNQIATVLTPPFDLLLGRRTWEIFAAYWPLMAADETGDGGIAALFNGCRKHVLTRSDRALDWHNSYRVSDMDAVAALKAADGPPLVIQGSSTLYPALLDRGLLDRLVLMTVPVVLGAGKRLLGEQTSPVTLRMVETRVGSGGTVVTTYEPAGAVQTAPAGPELPPGEAERMRRAAIAEGRW